MFSVWLMTFGFCVITVGIMAAVMLSENPEEMMIVSFDEEESA